ncbi:MAG: hypothetical protein M1812_002516 [Candelaria pacifica]|nr:MAG: hypothetical protein M1812_002516 [Candelaria pacifica]
MSDHSDLNETLERLRENYNKRVACSEARAADSEERAARLKNELAEMRRLAGIESSGLREVVEQYSKLCDDLQDRVPTFRLYSKDIPSKIMNDTFTKLFPDHADIGINKYDQGTIIAQGGTSVVGETSGSGGKNSVGAVSSDSSGDGVKKTSTEKNRDRKQAWKQRKQREWYERDRVAADNVKQIAELKKLLAAKESENSPFRGMWAVVENDAESTLAFHHFRCAKQKMKDGRRSLRNLHYKRFHEQHIIPKPDYFYLQSIFNFADATGCKKVQTGTNHTTGVFGQWSTTAMASSKGAGKDEQEASTVMDPQMRHAAFSGNYLSISLYPCLPQTPSRNLGLLHPTRSISMVKELWLKRKLCLPRHDPRHLCCLPITPRARPRNWLSTLRIASKYAEHSRASPLLEYNLL